MIQIVADPSKKIQYYFRVASLSTAKTIYLVDENGADFPVNTKTWQVNFKNRAGDSSNVIQLTSGDGLTIGSNFITFQLSATKSNVQVKEYYIEFRNVTDNQSLLTGNAIAHIGVFDNFETDNLTFTVSGSGFTRVFQDDSLSTLTPNISLYDAFELTAQAASLTIANPTGSIGNFDLFVIRVTDNGTARALTFGNKYRAFSSALPTTTTLGKTLYITCLYNATDDLYDTVTREEI